MRVSLEIEGGFAVVPGLRHPILIDSARLGAAARQRLAELLKEADFFALPAQLAEAPRGAADTRRYRLTVEDGVRRHSVSFGDPVGNQALVALRTFVRANAGSPFP